MARSRSSVNMYLNTEVFLKAKVALKALDSSVSEYVDDYLKLTLPLLETAAKTKDYRAVGGVMGSELAGLLAEAMRIGEGGEKPKKAKRK